LKEFFTYLSPYRDHPFWDGKDMTLTLMEKVIPLIIVVLLGVLLYKYRNKFKNNKSLDKKMRYGFGVLLAVIYSSHYIFRFALYGFDTIILPFHLCGIAMFLAVILLFTNNRILFSFVMLTGIAGGLISLTNPILGYDSGYYRYYQFFIAHGILVLVPFYYLFVYNFIPKTSEIIKSFIILQIIAIFMMVFNYYMNTDFMFLFFDKAKIEKFPSIAKFGGIPYYIILVEIAGMAYFAITALIFRLLESLEVIKA